MCKRHIDKRKVAEYATSEDFCKLFKGNVAGLYQLSFVLMGNHEEARQCFIAGLEDCVSGNPVYKQWARSWARRRIIQCAIRVIASGAQHTSDVLNVSALSEESYPLAAVLALDTLERFVFVMSILEGYSDRECSILLGCSCGEVANVRRRALRHLSKLDANSVELFADASFHPVT